VCTDISSIVEWLRQRIEQYAPRSINLLILFEIRKNCLRSGRSRLLYLSIRRVTKHTVVNYRGTSLLPTTYKILSNILLSRLTPYAEEIIGDHQRRFRCNRSTTHPIFCIRQILEKNENTMKQCINYLEISRKLMTQEECLV